MILCQVDVSDKNPRFQQLQQMGYTAVEYVGDNILDFPVLTQDLRNMDASAFNQFGEDYFLIPNPMYGSFDKNTTPDTM
jgi:predicted secreted acid phosphatase